MTTATEIVRAHARYNRWMNAKLYDAAAKLSDEERKRERGAFFGSIHGTLSHLLVTDRLWMLRFTHDAARYVSRDAEGREIPFVSLRQVPYDDFVVLRSERERTDADILAWVEALDESALLADVRYRSTDGREHVHPLYWAVTHFQNHETHHRGQVTTLLFQAGVDPGVTDLLAMLREENASGR